MMRKNIIIAVLLLIALFSSILAFHYYQAFNKLMAAFRNSIILAPTHTLKKSIKSSRPFVNDSSIIVYDDFVHVYDSTFVGKLPPNEISAHTAARIAESVWYSRFGNEIFKCLPLVVYSAKDIWVVTTKNPADNEIGDPYMEISKKDGRIVRYILGKI